MLDRDSTCFLLFDWIVFGFVRYTDADKGHSHYVRLVSSIEKTCPQAISDHMSVEKELNIKNIYISRQI